MLEALWSVEFVSNAGISGAGVVVFETNRIFGGDGQYYYTGTYSVSNGTLNGNLDVVHYAGEPWSAFGTLKSFSLVLSGALNEQMFEVEGSLKEDSTRKILIRLTKRAELP